jgi:hypothetical protein
MLAFWFTFFITRKDNNQNLYHFYSEESIIYVPILNPPDSLCLKTLKEVISSH